MPLLADICSHSLSVRILYHLRQIAGCTCEERYVNFSFDSENTEIRNTHINIGTGVDVSIKDLANLIKKEVGYKGSFIFNTSKPDGTMKKLTDVSKLNSLGWKHKIPLEKGVEKMYSWYLS